MKGLRRAVFDCSVIQLAGMNLNFSDLLLSQRMKPAEINIQKDHGPPLFTLNVLQTGLPVLILCPSAIREG